jgi:hypothetical protein
VAEKSARIITCFAVVMERKGLPYLQQWWRMLALGCHWVQRAGAAY